MRNDLDILQARAKALHLNGLLIHWQEAAKGGWVPALLDCADCPYIKPKNGSSVASSAVGSISFQL